MAFIIRKNGGASFSPGASESSQWICLESSVPAPASGLFQFPMYIWHLPWLLLCLNLRPSLVFTFLQLCQCCSLPDTTSYSLSVHLNEWSHPGVLSSHALCLKILVVPGSVWKEHSLAAQVCQPGEFLGPVTVMAARGPQAARGSWGVPECVVISGTQLFLGLCDSASALARTQSPTPYRLL